MSSRLLFALLLSTVAFGCTAVADDDAVDSSENEYRTKPKGPDATGGSLRVVPPPVPAGATLAATTFRIDAEAQHTWTPVGQTRSSILAGRTG